MPVPTFHSSSKRSSISQAKKPETTVTVVVAPFAAARPTTASANKKRPPYQPSDKRVPWRMPGNCQIPDIIKRSHPPNPKQQPKTTASRQSEKTTTGKPPTNKKPWVPVGKSPDILPLPTFTRRPKQHAVFDAKMRKVLPRQKVLDLNPRDVYIGMERVGSGANGAVIRATKRGGKKIQVAIKRCYIEDHDTHHHTYILRELRIMGTLSHANLVQLTEACIWGDYLWMAMELMTCSVFGLLYNVSVGLPEGFAIRIAMECLEGLVFLHSNNYMHRDIKCENILLSRSGQVKLADFGLATPLNRANTARLGTAKWMAPEVVSESPYKENVDVWSLGITIIEMMDRVPPLYYLEGNQEIFTEIVYGTPPTFNFTQPSGEMAHVVGMMLDTDPEHRPGAKCILSHIKQKVAEGKLKCARQIDIGTLVQEVFPEHDKSNKHP